MQERKPHEEEMDDDHEVILDTEPESSLWQRFYNFMIGPFVPEQLL